VNEKSRRNLLKKKLTKVLAKASLGFTFSLHFVEIIPERKSNSTLLHEEETGFSS